MCRFTIVPSGKLILRGFFVGRIVFIGVFFMTITDVTPVSATACVMGIDGFLSCMLDAHIWWRWCDKLSVTTVMSPLSTTMFCVGYKVGSETNDIRHFTSVCFAPHRHILGNWLLCIALVHASYPPPMYCPAVFQSKPSWWFARLHGVGHVFEICPSLTSNPHEKHTFQFKYFLMIF